MADPPHRCRLCSTNDQDALIEELAAELWDTIPGEDRTWAEAGGYWQHAFRQHAAAAVRILRS